MRLTLRDELPFVTIKIAYRGAEVEVPDVLVDTGSASTMLSADVIAPLGIVPDPQDTLRMIRGVGGTEVVFTRRVDLLQVGERSVSQFEVEVGGMDYGFTMNGILGMDFLVSTGAIINLRNLEIQF
jgi:predicted aspartyl protease